VNPSAHDDLHWMSLALQEAERGRGLVEPNPMVGAVVVKDGSLVGLGRHERFGGPHAEVMALRQAGDAARGATIYVTLEPCCHHGKTPPCTDAIRSAGLGRVVVAIRDPFPKVNGGGIAILRAAGIPVDLGVAAEAALALNQPFLKRVTTGKPYVIAKWAMTLDGKTAVAEGDSKWISSEGSRRLVHELRGRMDAILVGVETAILDDPLLTVRPPGPRTPTRIVLDRRARLPLTSRLVATASEVPVLVVVSEDAPLDRREALAGRGCEVLVIRASGAEFLSDLLDELGRREMSNLLVEGGGRVLGAFFDGGHVDQVEVFIAPILEGGDHARTPVRGHGVLRMSDATRLEQVRHQRVENDLYLQGWVPQPWRTALERFGS
jgi:diaminohydroxyphosphoribosylaminopyrimidine deaminase/5-amino-6-(5-phosphoribosylamino)uracil reductase